MNLIETRTNSNKKYLVDHRTEFRGACMWQYIEFTHEIGDGDDLYYFEAMGLNPTPSIHALIKADSVEQAEEYIQIEFGYMLERGSIVRQAKTPVRLIDERENR